LGQKAKDLSPFNISQINNETKKRKTKKSKEKSKDSKKKIVKEVGKKLYRSWKSYLLLKN